MHVKILILLTWFLFVTEAHFTPWVQHPLVFYITTETELIAVFPDHQKAQCLAAVDVWNTVLFPYGYATCVSGKTDKIADQTKRKKNHEN